MTASLIDILRDTLRHMEQSTDFQPDDPAMLKLRQEITATIFRLQIAKGFQFHKNLPRLANFSEAETHD